MSTETANSSKKRCCNLDWFEVFALEPITQPLTADYFRSHGYVVRERDYGTRVFRQMFTLEDGNGNAWLEVRRDPPSTLEAGGVMPINACHLRLTNWACYLDNCVQLLQDFMQTHGYSFQTLTRVDVCLDFVRFDTGDDPASFVRRYFKHKYSKINQANIHAHGADNWNGQEWNSLSWGKPTSQVSTKLYCKSLELKQVKDKPYIRQSWFECGLVDNPYTFEKRITSHGEESVQVVDVWRLEFSVRSGRKGWYTIEDNGKERDYHSYRNNLEQWQTRELCWQKFASLIPHYFRFKHYQLGQRKDRCKDKELFILSPSDTVYHLERIATAQHKDRLEQQLLTKLRYFRERHFDQEVRNAVDIIISCIRDGEIRSDFDSPFTAAELFAIRGAIARRLKGDERDPSAIINELTVLFRNSDEKPF